MYGTVGYATQAPQASWASQPVALTARLADASRDARVDETFGALPGAVAIAAFFVFVAQCISLVGDGIDLDDDVTPGRLKVAGISFGLLALCGFVEIFRRTRPTSLFFAGDRIGLYRHGKLDQVITPGQVTWYRLSFLNSIRELMLFGIVALFGGCGALTFGSSAMHGGGMDLAVVLIVIGVALGGMLALGSSIWSRWLCRHYIVPKGGGSETVVLPKSALDRLGVLRVGGFMGL